MKNRSRTAAYLSAAVTAVLLGGTAVQARDLVFDDTTLADDGTGTGSKYSLWDTGSSNWLEGTTPTTWLNSPPDNAIFGNTTNTFVGGVKLNQILLSEAITVQNLTIGTAANGWNYAISDAFGGSLTLAGNVTKAAGFGNPIIQLDNGLALTSGDHTFAAADTGGDDAPELKVDASIGGTGNVIVNNGTGVSSWGTTAFIRPNSYTGTTTITNGRLVITTSDGLGSTSAGTTIADLGTLSIGGSRTAVTAGVNLAEPITIQRSVYSGGEYGNYPAAIIFNNNGTAQTHTITGPITVDSADARIGVNSNTLVLPGGNFTFTPAATAAGAVVSFTGDFAGFVKLQGSNPQFAANGIKLVNGVEVSFDTDAALGGPTAPITFAGDATLDLTNHPTFTSISSFGSHPVNTTSFSGGLHLAPGQPFTVDQPLSGGRGLGLRGAGAVTINAPITGNGNIFWDGGTVAVNNAVTVSSLSLRSVVVSVGTGGSITTTANNQSFGASSDGTNGGPDKAILNLTGTGSFTQQQGNDFFLSDGQNTEGTINISDNASLTTNGLLHVARSAGGKGTINQTGGSFTLNRNGNFTLVLGSRAGTGTYNLSGGTMTSKGEFYVGQGGAGKGVFNMSGGAVNISNWFVVAREGGTSQGTVDISGGTFTQTGGNFSIGESNQDNTLKLRNSAAVSTTGEFWVGNLGGNKATMTMSDTAQLTVGSWFDIGRFGATGTLNFSGGTITKNNTSGTNTEWGVNSGGVAIVNMSGTGPSAAKFKALGGEVRIGTGGGGSATVVVDESASIESAGTFIVGRDGGTGTVTFKGNSSLTVSSGELWVGQNTGKGTLNIQDNATVSVQNNWLALGRANGASVGTLNLSGGTLTKAGGGYIAVGSGGTGTFNQTGGTLISNGTRVGEASNGTMNLTGGNATFTGEFSVGYQGNLVGTLNVGGNANVTVPDVIYGNTGTGTSGGSINLSGTAVLTGSSFRAGSTTSTGAKTLAFNGGTLRPSADNTNFIGARVTGIVSTNGANIDTNGKNVTVNGALTHDSALAGVDGGLTKNGAGTLAIAGANTYTGPTTVNAGTLAIGGGGTTGTLGTADVTVASGATLAFNRSDAFAVSNVISGAGGTQQTGTGTTTLTAANTYTGATTVSGGTLSLASAAWNPVLTGPGGAVVNAGKLVFDYTGTTSPAGTVVPLLKASHDSSNFRDAAQRFRTTNAANVAQGLGYYDDGASTLAIKYTWYGDANLNGKIDGDDYALLDRSFAKGLAPSWVSGDFNYDNLVDSADYLLIDTSFGQQSGGTLSPEFLATRQAQFGDAYVSQLIAAVPEPTTLGLVGLGAVAAFGRRRRNA